MEIIYEKKSILLPPVDVIVYIMLSLAVVSGKTMYWFQFISSDPCVFRYYNHRMALPILMSNLAFSRPLPDVSKKYFKLRQRVFLLLKVSNIFQYWALCDFDQT